MIRNLTWPSGLLSSIFIHSLRFSLWFIPLIIKKWLSVIYIQSSGLVPSVHIALAPIKTSHTLNDSIHGSICNERKEKYSGPGNAFDSLWSGELDCTTLCGSYSELGKAFKGDIRHRQPLQDTADSSSAAHNRRNSDVMQWACHIYLRISCCLIQRCCESSLCPTKQSFVCFPCH